MNCARICDKKKACQILGQCVFEHDYIKDNEEATEEMLAVSRVKYVLQVLHKHTQRRIVLGSYMGRGQFLYPGTYKFTGRKARRIIKKIRQSKQKAAVLVYKREKPVVKVLDPVTVRLYKARMKRVAALDVQFGYVYQETTRGDFHY